MNRATLLLILWASTACLVGCARAGSREGLITRAPADTAGASGSAGMGDAASPIVTPPDLSVDGSMVDSSAPPMHPAVAPQGTLSAGTVPPNPGAIFGAAEADPT
ncbi:MAG TPA: hypothetical protein VHW01_20135, partial [Polyangiaceae bacterium]|nr:hypothetical protein [Polyangiaceae bacterium]